MKYTATFEWPDDQEPRFGADDTWKGGKLLTVVFADEIARSERMQEAIEAHIRDLLGCVGVLKQYPPSFMKTVNEIEKAITELETATSTKEED